MITLIIGEIKLIVHLLSMLGCLVGFVMFLIMAIFTDGILFGQGAIAFLILFFLVYWNLKIELKKEDKITQEKSTKCLQIKKR